MERKKPASWLRRLRFGKGRSLSPGDGRQRDSPQLAESASLSLNEDAETQSQSREIVSLRAQNSVAVVSNAQVEVAAPQTHGSRLSADDAPSEDAWGSKCWESAFQVALRSFDSPDVKAVMESQGMGDLMSNLRQESDGLSKSSWFQKGLEKLQGPLKGVDYLLPLGRAFASLDPTASTAVGILSAFLTIAVAACGAAETINGNIVKMLKNVSIIDKCDTLSYSENAHKLLVEVYKELISFYLTTSRLLNSKAFTGRATIRQLSGDLEHATASFNDAANRLREFISLETSEITRETGNMVLDDTVKNRLGRQINQSRSELHSKMQQIRSNEACQWIFDDASFCNWLSSPASEFLVLYSGMGFGKTVVTSRVIDYLGEKAEAEIPHPFVLYHYCKNETEAGSLVNIYSSLTSQLLEKRVDLKRVFIEWDKERQKSSPVDPVLSPSELGGFLATHLKPIGRTLYIVLDGLDECNDQIIEPLIEFLQQLHKELPNLKVMFSSRPEEYVIRHLKGLKEVSRPQLQPRDRIIVEHHIKRQLPYLEPDLQTFLLNALASQSHGNAKYIELVIENIKQDSVTNRGTIEDFLAHFTYESVSKLYLELFRRVTQDKPRPRRCLSLALEIVATVRRPINVTELSYAIAMSEASKNASGFSAVADKVDIPMVKRLIIPFASAAQVEGVARAESDSPSPAAIQFHLSLTQLVIHEQPLKWTVGSVQEVDSSEDEKRENDKHRKHELDGKLLGFCSRYLLLDEFGNIDLLSETHNDVEGFDALPAYGLDYSDDEAGSDAGNAIGDDIGIFLDPASRGFGSFFTYASCFWLSHLESATQDCLPSIEKLLELSAVKSKRRRNWVDQYCRPDCTKGEKRDMPYRDPLAIVGCFGPPHLLKKMLDECNLEDKEVFTKNSIWAAQRLMLSRGRLDMCISLFNHPKAQKTEFFFNALHGYHEYYKYPGRQSGASPDVDPREWEALFCLVHGAADSLVKERVGNELLCLASAYGCMPMIRSLFNAAAGNASLRAELLRDRKTNSPEHLSVGQAVRTNRLEVVAFLLQQPGIETHLHHRNSLGYNVFHMAARFSANPKIVELLLEHFKEGANARDDECGATPMSHYAYQDAIDASLKSALLLVKVGEVDLLGRCLDEGDEPLRVAVRVCNEVWCRFLVEECGADPRSVLEFDSDGNPRFVGRLQDMPVSEEENEKWRRAMLDFMCTSANIKVGKEPEVADRPGKRVSLVLLDETTVMGAMGS